MNFISKIAAGMILAATAVSSASAAPVTIGQFTFDDSAFADSVSVVDGSVTNVGNMADGDVSTNARLGSGDVVQFGFTNTIINATGFDILVFELLAAPEVTALSLTLGGASVNGTLIESTGPDLSRINTFGFDLDDLGVAAGATLSGDVFLSRAFSGTTPDIGEIAGFDTGITAAIPLPAGMFLVLTGLGVFGWVARRRAA
ncbi:MAG: VPLPA-CTERM sorting domain-containing protein [Pseudomonadota bacterium]